MIQARPSSIQSLPAGAAAAVVRGAGSEIVRAAFEPADDLDAAERHTRSLARGHYENFSVVSLLLPRELRQDFCNLYAFCRSADDLADEIGDPDVSLRCLADFRAALQAAYEGRPRGAIFVALAATVSRHDIPIEPLLDLLDAFEQDQRVSRYETTQQLLDYCRRSANPVGRLVLYVCGRRDAERQALSDKICTALQLANFWQDVRRDLIDRDRIYLPADSMRRFGVSEESIRQGIERGRGDEAFRRLIRFEVERTEAMFAEGSRLIPLLDRRVRRQISLFGAGGSAILRAIARQDHDTLGRRPSLSAWQKGRLIFRATLTAAAVGLGGSTSPREPGASCAVGAPGEIRA